MIAALLAAIVGGGIVVLAKVDPDRLKPPIEAAVKQATGRDLRLNGSIRLRWSLRPSIEATDVEFTNPAGFSQPVMAKLQRLDLQLALLPLLRDRIEVEHLVLVRPDLLLETDAHGRTNWTFATRSHPTTDHQAPPVRISMRTVQIVDGTIAYHDEQSRRDASFHVTDLLMQAESLDSPMHLNMQASVNGASVSVKGDVGPISQLAASARAAPWPMKLTLTAGDATMTIDGSIGHLTKGRLYDLLVTANAPDIAPLAAFLPGSRFPPLRDASLSAHLVDTGSHAELNVAFQLAGMHAAAKGTIADMVHLAGVDIALTADAPDLVAVTQLAGRPLPRLRSIRFHARLSEAAGTLSRGVALRDMEFVSEPAAMTGDVIAEFGSRPALRAKLVASRIDADALHGADEAVLPRQAGPETTGAVIPDTPLPFDLLRAADADVEVSVDTLHSHRIDYRTLAARLALKNGRLQIAPFTADLPEGRVTGTLSVDVMKDIPHIDVTLHAAGLALQPLLTALHLSVEASGKLRVSLELHAAGNTPREIAAGLRGHLGLAMVRGQVSHWLFSHTLGWVLREAGLPGLATEVGTSQLRCFALRLDVDDGIGELSSLLIDSSRLYLEGDGTVRLRDETLDLSLRPEVRVGGIGVFVPLHLTGTFAHPLVRPAPIVAAQANASMLVSAAKWLATPVVRVAEILGIIAPGARGIDDCTDPLELARATEIPLNSLPPLASLQLAR